MKNHMEYLLEEWDREKNGSLMPENVTAKSHTKVWWVLSYDDENTGRHFDFSWNARIAHRINGNGCPYLSGRAVWKGFNDLTTTHPELAAQWDYGKNGSLTPENVTAGSNKKVWWLFPYDDSKTGSHFNFSWNARIKDRVDGHGCPYLSGHKVWKGFNDLATTHPELAVQWDYEKNKNLTPENVSAGSGKKVWWVFSYNNPKTGRHFNFSWQAAINSRTKGLGCPYLSGKAVWKGFNDLETYCKENGRLDILNWWDYEKNGDLKPSDVTAGSNRKVWWIKNRKSELKQISNFTHKQICK